MNNMSSSNNQGGPGPSKKSRGRQKVSMVKMEKQSNLQVTFSKRRAGLFKKASELCTLCGAEAAIVVFSPADKAYCFGHPNLALLDRVSEGAGPPPTDPRQLLMEAHRNSTIRQLNMELTQSEGLLRAEKMRAREISKMTCPDLEGFTYEQLCVLQDSVMDFKNKVDDYKVRNQIDATKLSLGSAEPGLYSTGFGNFGLYAPAQTSIATAGDHDYGMFNFIEGSNTNTAKTNMLTDHSRAIGFGGHEYDHPGFF